MHRLRSLSCPALKPVLLYLLFLFIALILWAGMLSGCATQQQVRDIVSESNAALVTATILGSNASLLPYPGEGPGPDRTGDEPWVVPSEKIEAFIEAYPDQKAAASALRVRQGILLLSYKQVNLARAAFNMVEPQYLTTARDKAIYKLYPHLIWWFRVDRDSPMSLEQFKEADKALEALQAEIATLAGSPGIRDYLAEMQAWVALSAARQTTNRAKARDYFENGMNHYADIFTNEDLEALKKDTEQSRWDASIEAVRRRIRSRAVIRYAKQVMEIQGIEPNIKSPAFSELVKGPT